MKAAILVEQRQHLIIDNVELPETIKYGQVLVKVMYSGICGSQLGEIDGAKGIDKYLPHLLGHEGSGIVEEVGEGVTMVKPGDHVVLHWREGKGITAATPIYGWNGKRVNAGPITTFNEYAIVSENRVTPLLKNIGLRTASLYGCAITTAFGVIHNDANVKSGESVIVFGCGGVGTPIIYSATLVAAYPIIGIDINEYKLQQAGKWGATHCFNSMEDIRKKILNILPQGADVVIDTTGIKQVRELAYEMTSSEGRTILVGVPHQGEKMSLDTLPLHFTKRIKGSHGGSACPSYDIPRLIRLQENRILNVEGMISKIYRLQEVNEAIKMVRQGEVLRCLIAMSHAPEQTQP